MVADLPTNTSSLFQEFHATRNDCPLLFYIIVKCLACLVFFADVIGRRGNNKLNASIGDIRKKVLAIAVVKDYIRFL